MLRGVACWHVEAQGDGFAVTTTVPLGEALLPRVDGRGFLIGREDEDGAFVVDAESFEAPPLARRDEPADTDGVTK